MPQEESTVKSLADEGIARPVIGSIHFFPDSEVRLLVHTCRFFNKFLKQEQKKRIQARDELSDLTYVGNERGVQSALDADPELLLRENKKGWTILQEAITFAKVFRDVKRCSTVKLIANYIDRSKSWSEKKDLQIKELKEGDHLFKLIIQRCSNKQADANQAFSKLTTIVFRAISDAQREILNENFEGLKDLVRNELNMGFPADTIKEQLLYHYQMLFPGSVNCERMLKFNELFPDSHASLSCV